MYIDAGRKEVDDLLGKMERKVAKEYKQAAKEVEQKLNDYLLKFADKDKKKQEQLNSGQITQADYERWRTGQIAMGNRWRNLRDDLAQDYTNAGRIAESIVDGYMPEVYAISHNYATYEVESGANIDTSYTLFDRQTVERLMRDNPQMLPKPGKQMSQAIRDGKVKRWNQKQVQSVMIQALLQGESIPKIAKRLANRVAVKDTKSAVRYARTMTTGAENAGRQNGYKRAIDMGVKMKQGWVAALDSRTRDEHRRLDGQQREVGKPFEVDGMKIMYPGDPTAPGKLVWNCRCCLVAVVAGSNQDLTDLSNRNTKKMGGMSYDEWKNAKRKKKENVAQETGTKAETIKEANAIMQKSLEKAYENHRIRNNTDSVPIQEIKETGFSPITSDYGKTISVESANAFNRTISNLMEEYDTPLQKVRTMSKDEFLYNRGAFAYVTHDYSADSATMVINQGKCKDYAALSNRIKELSEDGYCVKVDPSKAGEYVATHEYAHTILNIGQPISNKTNWVNANYEPIRKARKEIETIYESYMEEVETLTNNYKDYELKTIMASDVKEAEKFGVLASKAYDDLNAVKISDYSLIDVDEFMAEAFTNERIGVNSKHHAALVKGVIDKYFRR